MGCLEKICRSCGKTLPLDAFNKDNSRPDGRRSRCRECDAAHFREKYQDPEWKERHNNRGKDRRKELKNANPTELWAYDAMSNARQRARKHDLPCNIDVDYVRSLVVDTCPLLGLPIIYAQSKLSDCSPTLDRKHPALGYTRGNIAVISHRANRLKADSTIEELDRLLKNLINYMDSV